MVCSQKYIIPAVLYCIVGKYAYADMGNVYLCDNFGTANITSSLNVKN